MKKSLMTICLLLLAVALFAAYVSTTTVTSNAAAVIDTTNGTLFSYEAIYDADENTAVARSIDFFDTATVTTGIDHANYIRSITIAAGVYTVGNIFEGQLYSTWRRLEASGITYSNGLVVSPSAGTSAPIKGYYKYR